MVEQIRPLTEAMVNKGGRNDFPSQVTERPAPPASIIQRGSHFASDWKAGSRVHIDRDTSIVATVTAFCFRLAREPTIEVSYFHNGDSKTAWVEESRLTPAEA